MNAAQRANWEEIRAKGFWRFVLLNVVLILGGSLVIGLSVFDYFVTFMGFSLKKLMIKAVSILIVTFAAGTILWFINERRYRKSPAG